MLDVSEPSSGKASSGDRNDDDGPLSPHHVKGKEQQSTSSNSAADQALAADKALATDNAPAPDKAPAADPFPPPPAGSDQGSDDGISMMSSGSSASEQVGNGDIGHQARTAERERSRRPKAKRLPFFHNSIMKIHQAQKNWDKEKAEEKKEKKGKDRF